MLLAHHWPGNVRELRNVIERAIILETGDQVQPASLPDFQLETRLRRSPRPARPFPKRWMKRWPRLNET